jgi:hypothetical protein
MCTLMKITNGTRLWCEAQDVAGAGRAVQGATWIRCPHAVQPQACWSCEHIPEEMDPEWLPRNQMF